VRGLPAADGLPRVRALPVVPLPVHARALAAGAPARGALALRPEHVQGARRAALPRRPGRALRLCGCSQGARAASSLCSASQLLRTIFDDARLRPAVPCAVAGATLTPTLQARTGPCPPPRMPRSISRRRAAPCASAAPGLRGPPRPAVAEAARRAQAWRQGRTGYPLVDAGLRELWSTGWMHNRSRVVCASFLVKNLLLPWQWGLKHYWDAQLDADLECDALGWQYVSGCLAGAPRPYPGPPDSPRARLSLPLQGCAGPGAQRHKRRAVLPLPGHDRGAPAALDARAPRGAADALGACARAPGRAPATPYALCISAGAGHPVGAASRARPLHLPLRRCAEALGAPRRCAPLLVPDGPRGRSQALRPGRALCAPLAARPGAHARQVDPQARPRAAQPPPGPGSVLW
jgi:hypothetical protein